MSASNFLKNYMKASIKDDEDELMEVYLYWGCYDSSMPPLKCKNHTWVLTGMSWSFCKLCNVDGELNSETGKYEVRTK